MVYDRRLPAHSAFVGGMVLLALIGCGILYLSARDRPEETVGLLILLVGMIVLPLLCTVLHVRVRLTGTGHPAGATLTVALWPLWRRRIPVERITSAEIVTVRAFGDFGGIGLKFSTSGELGLVMRSGEGVRVTTDDGRVCTVVVPTPEELVHRLDAIRSGT